MISKNSYKEVIKNLKKLGAQKIIDYKSFPLSKLFLNYSRHSDVDEYKDLNQKNKHPFSWSDLWTKMYDDEFVNINEKYLKYEDDDKNFYKKYDFYILKNELLGYDSKKLKMLKNSIRSPFLDCLDRNKEIKGIKQTLILINKKEIDQKAEFFLYRSQYPLIMFGDYALETQNYYLKLEKLIKEIFGWPIINYLVNSSIDIGLCFKNNFDNFEDYLKANNAKAISIEKYYKKSINTSANQYFSKTSKNQSIYKIHPDYLTRISQVDISAFTTINIWKNSDIPYLKFYELDRDFWDFIKNENINSQEEKNDYEQRKEFIDYFEEKNFLDNFYKLFEKNVIVNIFLSNPLLIWDQRNFRELNYKFIIPYNFLETISKNNIKHNNNLMIQKIDNINKIFQNYYEKLVKKNT